MTNSRCIRALTRLGSFRTNHSPAPIDHPGSFDASTALGPFRGHPCAELSTIAFPPFTRRARTQALV
jgi:hypothetical protein